MTYQSLNPLPHHDETTALVTASPEDVFAFIDDHERLLSHTQSMAGDAVRRFTSSAKPTGAVAA